MSDIVLYDYWRSSASYRVRIALNLKRLEYKIRPVNLLADEHRADSYLAVNPLGLVPTLLDGDLVLSQSRAIMEYLEEYYPIPLLPHEKKIRAQIRQFCDTIACDVHPLQNLRVKNALLQRVRIPFRKDLYPGFYEREENRIWREWIGEWMPAGFAALEKMLSAYSGSYCFGDYPTMADCCLVPQVYNAMRFGIDLDPYWRIRSVYENCMRHKTFQKAAPENQPDTPH